MRPRSLLFWLDLQVRQPAQRIWRNTSSTLKKAWVTLWIFGLVLFALGAWGDVDKFWENKPFLTNIISAMTGAAFGIPLALIILQRIAASEADAAEARAARRLARRVAAAMAWEALASIGNQEAELQAARDYFVSQVGEPGEFLYLESDLQTIYSVTAKAFERVDRLLSADTPRHLAEVSAHWSILNTEIRSRLLETGGSWLDAVTVEEFNAVIKSVTTEAISNWYSLKNAILAPPTTIGSSLSSEQFKFTTWLQNGIELIDNIKSLVERSSRMAQIFSDLHMRDIEQI